MLLHSMIVTSRWLVLFAAVQHQCAGARGCTRFTPHLLSGALQTKGCWCCTPCSCLDGGARTVTPASEVPHIMLCICSMQSPPCNIHWQSRSHLQHGGKEAGWVGETTQPVHDWVAMLYPLAELSNAGQ